MIEATSVPVLSCFCMFSPKKSRNIYVLSCEISGFKGTSKPENHRKTTHSRMKIMVFLAAQRVFDPAWSPGCGEHLALHGRHLGTWRFEGVIRVDFVNVSGWICCFLMFFEWREVVNMGTFTEKEGKSWVNVQNWEMLRRGTWGYPQSSSWDFTGMFHEINPPFLDSPTKSLYSPEFDRRALWISAIFDADQFHMRSTVGKQRCDLSTFYFTFYHVLR